MKNVQFELVSKNNKKIICDVIATYHDDNTNKDYIVYTDRTFDKDRKLKVYYSLYEKKDKSIKLIDIVDKEDKKIGLELVKSLIEDLK